MKKILILLFTILIIIVTIGLVKYNSYKTEYNKILKENAEYEQYKGKEIFGTELATIINKTIDTNNKNEISKDENGKYIENEKSSIKIDIYMKDTESIYTMESIYNGGMNKFIQYYGNIYFKCSEIEYHEENKKIKHILFEQI